MSSAKLLLRHWAYVLTLIPVAGLWFMFVRVIIEVPRRLATGESFTSLSATTQRVLVAIAACLTVAGLAAWHAWWARMIRRCTLCVYERGIEIVGISRMTVVRVAARHAELLSIHLGHEPQNWLERLPAGHGLAGETMEALLTIRLKSGATQRFDLLGAYYAPADVSRFFEEAVRASKDAEYLSPVSGRFLCSASHS